MPLDLGGQMTPHKKASAASSPSCAKAVFVTRSLGHSATAHKWRATMFRKTRTYGKRYRREIRTS